MKRYFLLLVVLFLFMSCGNDEDKADELTKIIQEEEKTTITTINEQVSEKAVSETVNPEYIMYTDHKGRNWEVYSYLHKNDKHVNGYVIFTKIIVKDDINSVYEKWEIDYAPNNYIEDIHYNLKSKFNGDSEVQDVVLQSDDRFDDAFRTAEAIYIAWEETGKNPVDIDSVSQAGKRMKGRKVGIMK